MKRNRKQKGFTLIEVLIVVVIIAVLAALILPRFLSQPERAVIAEAQLTLGALVRAQTQRADSAGGFLACAGIGAGAGTCQSVLGITPSVVKYNYACNALGSCTATRIGGPAGAAAGTITLTQAGSFACGAGYFPVIAAPAVNNRGCRV